MNKENNTNRSNKTTTKVVLAMALTATVAILILFIATFILLQLKFKEPIKITLSDWLKLIIPIVGGAIITVFAFLGVDRLKNFDERQDRLEHQLREDLEAQVNNAIKLVQPQLDETYSTWADSLQQKLSKYDDSLEKIEKRISRYDLIIGSVERIEEISDAIGNINEAHCFVNGLPEDDSNNTDTSEKSQSTRLIIVLVERVKNGEINGDSDDYHIFASELATRNYYELAADVTIKGLELFEDNIDLLSDYIYYSHKAGRKDDVSKGIAKLEKIEKNVWNWRAFTFYIDVLNDYAASEENMKKVLNCVELYKHVLPDEERAYMAEYETLIKYGDIKAAEDALLTAEKTLSMTAQCSLALSKIYHIRGNYDRAIESATRAILGQAETQPSSDTGAAFACRAFSTDAKIHKAILEGKEISSLYSEIQKAIEDFKMAAQLGYSYRNIAVRIKILQTLLPKEKQDELLLENIESRVQQIESVLKIILSNFESDVEE